MMEFLVLDFWNVVGLLSVGILAGILAGFFGIGGGAIIVPMMILLGNDIKIAIGISIMQMIFSSVYGTYVNYKKKNLDFKDGIYVGIGGLIGASFSGVIVSSVSSSVLEIVFSFFIVYSIVRFFFTNAYGGERRVGKGWKSVLFLVGCGCVVGIFAISLGIGGGIMLAPLLAYYLGYNSKNIVPISLFFIIFSSISGFTSLALHGYVDYMQGCIVGIASLVGVRIGIWVLSVVDSKKHKYALLAMYVFVLAVMFEKILFG